MIQFSRRNLLREKGGAGEHKVMFVELFFDLVFVFAVTQTAHFLIEHYSLLGGVQTLMILLAVWWVWMFTTWATNWVDPQKFEVRLMLFVMMLAGMLMSIAIPHAFDRLGLLFACAYAFMQVGRSLFMCWAVKQHHAAHFRNFLRISCWQIVSAVLWIGGGLSDPADRMAWWLFALAIEYISPALYFRVPWLGQSKTTEWDISGEHMAERCGLLIIIALGESLLVTGSTFEQLPWNSASTVAFINAFVCTVAMWWLYFSIGAEHASHEIARSKDPGRLGRLAYTYLHFIILVAIVLVAAADEFVLVHPHGHVSYGMLLAVVGGPMLYLAGNLLFKRAVFNSYPLSHWVGIGLLVLLIPASLWLDPLQLSIGSTLCLVVAGVWETWSMRHRLGC